MESESLAKNNAKDQDFLSVDEIEVDLVTVVKRRRRIVRDDAELRTDADASNEEVEVGHRSL